MRILIALLLVLLLGACSGGGGGGSGAQVVIPPPALPATLPPLTSLRSDLLDQSEGTYVKPLEVTPCLYAITGSMIVGQFATCNNPNTIYKQSNAFRSGDAYFTWRVAVNNEASWEYSYENTGPPNQSKALDGRPFGLSSTENSITLRLDTNGYLDNGGKIPYLGIAFVRGVQGDPISRVSAWGAKPEVAFTVQLKKVVAPQSPTSQWIHVWFIFRAANGDKIMVTHAPHGPSDEFGRTCRYPSHRPEDGCYMWNWPAKNSYYYPGAWLMRMESDGTNLVREGVPTRLTFDVEAVARKIFPAIDTVAPDFIGFEVAIEQGYQAPDLSRMMTEVTLSDFSLK